MTIVYECVCMCIIYIAKPASEIAVVIILNHHHHHSLSSIEIDFYIMFFSSDPILNFEHNPEDTSKAIPSRVSSLDL